MSVITLTSDYGSKDFFVSAIKGAILKELNQAVIVDISHEITPFNLSECAYITKNSYHNFPKNSIHIIAIDTEKQKNQKHIVAYCDNHYFITSDCGILSLIFPNININNIFKINISEDTETELFPGRDIFAKIACHILRGGKLNVIGEKLNSYKYFTASSPVDINQEKSLIGHIIYIDRFGNLITNIEKDLFYTKKRDRDFVIYLPRGQKVYNINKTYSDVDDGMILVLFNSTKLLEIAINRADQNVQSGASSLLGIKQGDQIIIDFKNKN